jgi:hypothetical protein
MAEDLKDTIRETAQGPKRVTGDSGSVEQQDLSRLIEADRHLASKDAAKKGLKGILRTKVIPPGAS